MTNADARRASDTAALLADVARAADAPAAREPLTALLLLPDPITPLRALEASGALARWLPEVAALRGVSQLPDHPIDALDHSYQACAAAPPTPLSRWTALLHDSGKATTAIYTPQGRTRFFGHETVGAAIAERRLPALGCDPGFVAAVARIIRLHLRPLAYRATWTDGAVLRLLAEAGPLWPALLAQCRADLLGYAPEPVDRALAHLDALALRAEQVTHPPPPPPGSPLDGYELQALFERPPGPWLRAVKTALEREVRAGRLAPDDKIAATAFAARFIHEGHEEPHRDG